MTATELVRIIHDTPQKAVLAITGGGAEAIGELLRHGNGSKTLLEAVVPYDQNAFDDFVKGKPDKYCSPEAARDLAMAAYMRAAKLTGTFDKVVGVGASCSLAKEGERTGRKHVVHIAVQTCARTDTFNYEITASREDEEKFAADRILDALAGACGLNNWIVPTLQTQNQKINCTMAPEWASSVIREQITHYTVKINPATKTKLLLPGAFNPVHDRHLEMAHVAHKLKGEHVDFELCVKNVDKSPLNFHEIETRHQQLELALREHSWAGNLHFTNTPTFAKKAELFPGTTFVIGFDTFQRIGDLKYYDGDPAKRFQAIDKIRLLGCKFLVFHRIVNGRRTSELDVVFLPAELVALAEVVPESELTPNDTSSSGIRK